MLIDTHAHLYWDNFKEDFDEVIKRALDAGVTTIINVGVDVGKSQEALDQVQNTNWPKTLQVYSTIGIHPHEAVRYAQFGQKYHDRDKNVRGDIRKLEQIYRSGAEKVLAVGECGLDYLFEVNDFYPDTSLPKESLKDMQRKFFQAQINLAKKLNLPLIVHCRDDRFQNPINSEAWDEAVQMTKDWYGIYHCYSGLPQTTNKIIQTTKFLISFAGNLTYPKNEYLKEAVKALPLDRTVLETDCPFLPPQSKRGMRNEPANVLEIAQLIAEMKGISLEEVGTQTTNNVKKLFNIEILTLRFRTT